MSNRLKMYFTELLSSILATMQSSVAQLPHRFQDAENTLPVLPLLEQQGTWFDGKEYTWKGANAKEREKSCLLKPDLPQTKRYPPDPYTKRPDDAQNGMKQDITGTVLSRLPAYRRSETFFARGSKQDGMVTVDVVGLDSQAWRAEFSTDAWEVARMAILHACGPSCWKYNKKKMENKNYQPTCRHECYHFVTLPEKAAPKCFAQGKRLRNVVHLDTDETTNMKGRVQGFQTQPFEGNKS